MVSENPRTAYEQKEMALGETGGGGRGGRREGRERDGWRGEELVGNPEQILPS